MVFLWGKERSRPHATLRLRAGVNLLQAGAVGLPGRPPGPVWPSAGAFCCPEAAGQTGTLMSPRRRAARLTPSKGTPCPGACPCAEARAADQGPHGPRWVVAVGLWGGKPFLPRRPTAGPLSVHSVETFQMEHSVHRERRLPSLSVQKQRPFRSLFPFHGSGAICNAP